MALNDAVLGADMAAAVGCTDAAGLAAWNAIATVIVNHIRANATVTVTVDTVTGTATGAMGGGAGVPVVGTGSGTATIT